MISIFHSLDRENCKRLDTDRLVDDGNMDQTFNESCCRANGVPEECMANCIDVREWDRFGLRMGKLHSRCTKYEKVIENCIVPVSNGNFCSQFMRKNLF